MQYEILDFDNDFTFDKVSNMKNNDNLIFKKNKTAVVVNKNINDDDNINSDFGWDITLFDYAMNILYYSGYDNIDDLECSFKALTKDLYAEIENCKCEV